MSRRTVVLAVALLLAGVAAFAVWRYLASVENQVRADLDEVVVYRATALIAAGTPGAEAASSIEPDQALVRDVVFAGSTILCAGPVDRDGAADAGICEGNPSDLNDLLSSGITAGPISAGQVITQDMFVAAASVDPNRLATDVPDGKVAVAVSPGEVGAVGGFLAPGDRVNVLATLTFSVETYKTILANPDTRDLLLQGAVLPDFLTGTIGAQPPAEDEETDPDTDTTDGPADPLAAYVASFPDSVTFTRTILQNIPVLAVGEGTVSDPQAASDTASDGELSVVLEVVPAEAEVLEFARQNGVIGLSLLPAGETNTELDLLGATIDDVTLFSDRLIALLEAANAG
ncbi:MAG: RcpC/CpaB family pilus assembly protein [Actinomycetota bacterium]|nr:RcpC/CpaB family pilus assembly protein [Actinomycetota bacterium]